MFRWESSWFSDVHFAAAVPVGGCSDDVLGGLLLTACLWFQGIRVGWWLGNTNLYLAGERRVLFDIQIRLSFRYYIVSLHEEYKKKSNNNSSIFFTFPVLIVYNFPIAMLEDILVGTRKLEIKLYLI